MSNSSKGLQNIYLCVKLFNPILPFIHKLLTSNKASISLLMTYCDIRIEFTDVLSQKAQIRQFLLHTSETNMSRCRGRLVDENKTGLHRLSVLDPRNKMMISTASAQ
jgi:hypothetical protein